MSGTRRTRKPQPKRKPGRPPQYDPDVHPILASAYARDGCTVPEIARRLKVHLRTVNKWMAAHPEFGQAVKEGRHITDTKVENALLRRALGYEFEERKTIVGGGRGGGDAETVKIEKTTKHIAPDVIAAIFWLKNRRPDVWRDRREQALLGPDGGPLRVSTEMDELRQQIKTDPRLAAAADAFERELARVAGRHGQSADKPQVDLGGSPAADLAVGKAGGDAEGPAVHHRDATASREE